MPSPLPLEVTPLGARRFLRRALGFDEPHANVAAALGYYGYVQIDPINICGRMHDLILRNRVAGYREGDLHRLIHSPARPGFEHYLPGAGVLAAFPVDAWRYLSGLIASRHLRRGVYGRKLGPKGERIAEHILAEITRRGPLTSDDIEHEGRSLTGWGTPGRLVKNLLEILFIHGRVLITQRRNFRRVYDLPERVLPPGVLKAESAPAGEVARWVILTRLRQRRLVTLRREEVRLIEDAVQPVTVAGCPPLFCLHEDVPLLLQCSSRPEDADTDNPATRARLFTPDATQTSLHLLAPLDPIIYDRRLTRALWNFEYTWEAYTPPLKRVRGYYALPVLAGTEIVGHVDVKADRAQRKLVVVSRQMRRGHATTPVLREFARWLGLRAR